MENGKKEEEKEPRDLPAGANVVNPAPKKAMTEAAETQGKKAQADTQAAERVMQVSMAQFVEETNDEEDEIHAQLEAFTAPQRDKRCRTGPKSRAQAPNTQPESAKAANAKPIAEMKGNTEENSKADSKTKTTTATKVGVKQIDDIAKAPTRASETETTKETSRLATKSKKGVGLRPASATEAGPRKSATKLASKTQGPAKGSRIQEPSPAPVKQADKPAIVSKSGKAQTKSASKAASAPSEKPQAKSAGQNLNPAVLSLISS